MKITTSQLRQIIREEIAKAKVKQRPLTLKEASRPINEDIDPVQMFLLFQAATAVGGALGVLAGKLARPMDMDNRNVWQRIKDWWKSRKDTAAIEKIVKRLNADPEVVEFVKSGKRTGWRDLLKNKLTGSEVNYLNKIYKTHIGEGYGPVIKNMGYTADKTEPSEYTKDGAGLLKKELRKKK